jgi:putative SOS response-associated peptidase YedK
MCGRFTAPFEFREIKLLFNLQRDIPLLIRRYNIAPSQEVPVIVQNEGVNELKPMKWGLVPAWSPDPSIGNNMITFTQIEARLPIEEQLSLQLRRFIEANIPELTVKVRVEIGSEDDTQK